MANWVFTVGKVVSRKVIDEKAIVDWMPKKVVPPVIDETWVPWSRTLEIYQAERLAKLAAKAVTRVEKTSVVNCRAGFVPPPAMPWSRLLLKLWEPRICWIAVPFSVPPSKVSETEEGAPSAVS